MTQPDLFSVTKAQRVTEADVAWLLRVLHRRGWMRARDIVSQHFVGGSDRELRAIAAASHGQIVSGQKGYCRTDQASVEDVNHAAAWLLTQAAAMTKRAREIQRAMHKRVAA